MTTFKNANFDENAECTVIKFAQGVKPAKGDWVECSEKEIDCPSLFVQAGTRYFGYV
jgi:hypothetical protein